MARKKALGLRNFDKNRENPFVIEAIKEIKIAKKTSFMNASKKTEISMIVSNDGEVQGYSQFLKFIEVDEEKFAKVYLSQFEAFWELPKSAIKVFGYILHQLKPKQDRIDFYIDDCLDYTKYQSTGPIYEGLTSLCKNLIIARGPNEYLYYINPLVVFNGDRVTFAKTYIKKQKQEKLHTDPNQTNLLDAIKEMGGKV